MNVRKQIEYWLTTAEVDLETAKIILDAGRNLHHCLFLCHLVLEKGLKALVVRHTEDFPPKIHDLEILAEKADLKLSEELKNFLFTMTKFNLEAR